MGICWTIEPNMRVLTFLHSFEAGGVERIALRLVRAWRGAGIEAPLFMGRSDGPMRNELARALEFHQPRQPPFSTRRFETLWMMITLPAVIRRLQPDLLFCAGNSYTVVALAMKLLLGRRCPPIVAKISNDLERRDMPMPIRTLYRLWVRLHARFIDHFVGMEHAMEREISSAIHIPSRCISIIADPAIDQRQLETLRAGATGRRRQENEGLQFVAVGRLVPQKNFGLMLRAFAVAATTRDCLKIYGDGPERERLAALALQLGIEDRVRFKGHVPDPARHLTGFDIFLLSSNYEGVPAVIIEALGAGLPIIATDCSSAMSELTQHGRLATLVPVGNLYDLAAAIAAARRMDQCEDASYSQAKRFTIEQACGDYITCFKHVTYNSISENNCHPQAEVRS